jgi:outer membrane autotransporter protein
MRSYRWRSQHAAPPAAPGTAIRDRVIQTAAPAARAPLRRAALLGTVLLATLTPNAGHATDGTWTGPGAEWTLGTNWNSSPTVPDNTATFTNNFAPTTVTISNPATINTIQFTSSAPAYNFTLGFCVCVILSVNGIGIVNNSSSAQTFDSFGTVTFNNNASTAGSVTINNNLTGILNFNDMSTAGSATITNTLLSFVNFNDTSTAGSAAITNNFAFIQFNNASTAANATITNNGSVAFFGTSSAGNSAIINNGGGSLISFSDNTTAGNATITTNNGANTQFTTNSTGGNAQFITNAGGIVDFSGTSGPLGDGKISAGSIAGDGTYSLGGNQLSVGGNNLPTTVSGTIQDGGLSGGTGASLVKVGIGTLTLTGTNTYGGGTTINAGVLAVGSDSNLGNSTGGLAFGGGTLQFLSGFTSNRAVTLNSGGGTFDTNGNAATLTGPISGPGGVTKIGGGTLTLAGSSTYSGATAVNLGTLQGGSVNAFSPLSAFTVATGATLDLAGFNQSIGSLAGAGAVTLGSARLTTGSDNTNTTFSGMISGTGGLTKIGAGALTLSGSSGYSGATMVNAGTLIVNGSIASSAVTVNSGGTLAGTGTVGATTINSGGTLAPGNSPGTITVQGNLALQSGALYLVQVTPSIASSTNATGTASLAGTVGVLFSSGTFAHSYRILSAAGGLGGTTFGALTTSNLPTNFAASLSYTPTDVVLNLNAVVGQGAGLSQNQQNVATSLNGFFNNGGPLPRGFVSVFGLTGGNLANALSQLSGEAATGGQQVAFQMTNQFLGLMLDPFVDGRSGVAGASGPALGFAPEREDLPDDIAFAYSSVLKAPPAKAPSFEQRWSVWGGAYGGSNRTSGDPAVIGSHDLAAGFAAGLDYHLTPNTVVGMALAGGGTYWSLANGLGGGKSDAFQAGIYGATRSGPAYLAAALSYTNHWMSTDRFAFAGDHLTASFNAQSYGARVESGYRFATMFGGLTPYAAVQAQNVRTPSYSESDLNGGGFALAYNSRTGTDTRSELGARFDRLLALNPNAVLTLRARLAWAHDWVSDPTLAAVFQALPGASFIVNGATPAKNSALASAGTELRLANGVTLLAKFDGELASHSSTYAGTGTLRYAW